MNSNSRTIVPSFTGDLAAAAARVTFVQQYNALAFPDPILIQRRICAAHNPLHDATQTINMRAAIRHSRFRVNFLFEIMLEVCSPETLAIWKDAGGDMNEVQALARDRGDEEWQGVIPGFLEFVDHLKAQEAWFEEQTRYKADCEAYLGWLRWDIVRNAEAVARYEGFLRQTEDEEFTQALRLLAKCCRDA